MIRIETISSNVLKIVVPDKLKEDDFKLIAPQVDALISQYGRVRLLLDGTGFNGWDSIAAFENHAGFVKTHQAKVERLAVITGHEWQQWLIGTFKIFLHPQVRAFDAVHAGDALHWITQ